MYCTVKIHGYVVSVYTVLPLLMTDHQSSYLTRISWMSGTKRRLLGLGSGGPEGDFFTSPSCRALGSGLAARERGVGGLQPDTSVLRPWYTWKCYVYIYISITTSSYNIDVDIMYVSDFLHTTSMILDCGGLSLEWPPQIWGCEMNVYKIANLSSVLP